jgi:prolipoprotein diacylglyceryltransferase
MENISYIALIIFVGVVFVILRASNSWESKKIGSKRDSSEKLFFVAVIFVLCLLGLFVLTGDFK